MTHGDPAAAAAGQAHAAPPRGRQTPVLTATELATSGGEDSAGENTPMSSKSGKMMSVKILMLDDSITVFQIQVRTFFSQNL